MPPILDSIAAVIHASRRSPRPIVAGMALRVLDLGLSIAPFFLAQSWLTATIDGGPAAPALLALALAALLAARILCSHLGQLWCFLGGYRLMTGYRERVIDHLSHLPLGAVRAGRTGRLAAIVTDDVRRVEAIVTHLAPDLAATVIVTPLGLAALATIDWRLTLAVALPLPVAVIALNRLGRFFLIRGERKQSLFLDGSGLLVEYVGGLKTLLLFDRAGPWLDRLDRHFADIRAASLGVEAWGGGSIQMFRLTVEFALVALILAGAALAGTGTLSPAEWLLFVLVTPKLLDPVLEAAAFLTELRALRLCENRVRAVLDQPVIAEGRAPPPPAPAAVAFDHVGFSHGGGWALRDVSFRAEPGTVTAIVGPSGAGKSTLLDLLARFHDPQSGRITLGERDVRDIPLDSLYQHLGMVFQDVQLFDATILDNVRIGRAEAGDEAVIAACRAACCDRFIAALPDGYHTRIGENGQCLSGGERQRLSIARALLKDAPILLLDEATASVDPAAQGEIQQALSRLARDRTVIVIAHRLPTIRHADQILVVEDGRIVERGRHADLIGGDGLYAALWRGQSGDDGA